MSHQNPQFLECRPSGFYFRRTYRAPACPSPDAPAPQPERRAKAGMPRGEEARVCRKAIVLSLQTQNESLARRLARRLAAESDLLLDKGRNPLGLLPHDMILGILKEALDAERDAYERARILSRASVPSSRGYAAVPAAVFRLSRSGWQTEPTSLTPDEPTTDLPAADGGPRLLFKSSRAIAKPEALVQDKDSLCKGDLNPFRNLVEPIDPARGTGPAPALAPVVLVDAASSEQAHTHAPRSQPRHAHASSPVPKGRPLPLGASRKRKPSKAGGSDPVQMPERVTEASTVDLADLRIDARLLTPATRQALRAPRSIRLKQAFDLLFELGCLGYNTKDFTSTRKRNEPTGARWEKESLPSYGISARIALDYFGDVPILAIPEADVTAYIEHVKRIPARHGKTYRLDLSKGYRALIRGADLAEKHQLAEAERRIAETPNMPNDRREKLRNEARIARLSVTTYVKHCRRLQAAGRILEHLGLIPRNPFAVCSWTHDEENDLRQFDLNPKRHAWDDQINDLLAMPVFRGKYASKDDPMFWVPLMCIHQGFRMEECLQLPLADIGTERGIPYIWLHRGLGIRLKEGSSERRVPIHPNLIELGFLELVADQRKAGAINLFPNLKRGKTKQKFSELFTKRFTYQRKKNGVYTPGKDAHALRTTFHTHLMDAETIQDARRNYLTGHRPKDTGARNYGKASLERLRKDIEHVKVDISKVVSPYRPLPTHHQRKDGFDQAFRPMTPPQTAPSAILN